MTGFDIVESAEPHDSTRGVIGLGCTDRLPTAPR